MYNHYQCRICGKQLAGHGFYLKLRTSKPTDQWYQMKHCGQPVLGRKRELDRQIVKYKNKVTNELYTTGETAFRIPQARKEKERMAIMDMFTGRAKKRE